MRSAIISLVLYASLAHAGDARSSAKQHFEKGTKLYNLGDYKHASEEFRAAYIAVPDASFLFNIGQCARFLGQPEEAVRSYRAFLRERPDSVNREAVERFIQTQEEAIRDREAKKRHDAPAAVAPTETRAGPSAQPATPAPAVSQNGAAASTAAPAPRARRWWVWALVGGAAAVVAGVAIALAIVLTPRDAPTPPADLGSTAIHF
jgi:tetratricopeptide (TPR) repeat protein